MDYGKSQVNLVNKAIKNFDWNELFSGQNIHHQIKSLNTTILKIFWNFIPNKAILCDIKEPLWVNDEIRLLIKQKNWYIRHKQKIMILMWVLWVNCQNTITNSKLAYYRRIASKLNDPNTVTKSYWSILKSFVNGKKIPLIAPILVNDQFVTKIFGKSKLI